MNALLELNSLPRFDAFLPEQIEPAIKLLLNQAQQAVTIAQTATPTWNAFYEPMELAIERLQRAWGMVNHLNAVDDSEPLRQAYEAKLTEVTAFFTALGQNQALFDQYKRLSQSADFAQWPTARQRIVSNALRDFVLSGAALTGPARKFKSN
jgi:oligopeptidase A